MKAAELLKNRSCGDQYEQLKYQGADLVVVISSQGQTMWSNACLLFMYTKACQAATKRPHKVGDIAT